MRWYFWIMLSLIGLWAAASMAQNAVDAEVLEHQKKGIALFKERKYAEAIAEFQAFLSADSTNVQVLYAVGVCYHNEKQYDKAMVYFRKVMAQDAAFTKARRALAEALFAKARGLLVKKKYKPALEGFLEAASIDSLNARIVYHAGLAYARMDRMEQAIDAYRKATEMDTAYAPPNAALGRIFLKKEAYPQAIKYLERALAIDHRIPKVPDNLTVAYERMAYTYTQKGSYTKATQAALESLKYDPGNMAARVALGEAYEGLGKVEEAIEQYEIAKADLMWQQYVEDRIKRLTKTDEDTE